MNIHCWPKFCPFFIILSPAAEPSDGFRPCGRPSAEINWASSGYQSQRERILDVFFCKNSPPAIFYPPLHHGKVVSSNTYILYYIVLAYPKSRGTKFLHKMFANNLQDIWVPANPWRGRSCNLSKLFVSDFCISISTLSWFAQSLDMSWISIPKKATNEGKEGQIQFKRC